MQSPQVGGTQLITLPGHGEDTCWWGWLNLWKFNRPFSLLVGKFMKFSFKKSLLTFSFYYFFVLDTVVNALYFYIVTHFAQPLSESGIINFSHLSNEEIKTQRSQALSQSHPALDEQPWELDSPCKVHVFNHSNLSSSWERRWRSKDGQDRNDILGIIFLEAKPRTKDTISVQRNLKQW